MVLRRPVELAALIRHWAWSRMLADRVASTSLSQKAKNMRQFICIAVALGISAITLRAQDQPKFSPVQQEVLDAHKARVGASEKRDYATWSRLVADDCM